MGTPARLLEREVQLSAGPRVPADTELLVANAPARPLTPAPPRRDAVYGRAGRCEPLGFRSACTTAAGPPFPPPRAR
jgi:hypothetical protein